MKIKKEKLEDVFCAISMIIDTQIKLYTLEIESNKNQDDYYEKSIAHFKEIGDFIYNNMFHIPKDQDYLYVPQMTKEDVTHIGSVINLGTKRGNCYE